MVEEPLGEVGERVEGVVEFLDGGSIGQTEAQVVRCDHVERVGQPRNQVAEHEGAGGKSVQQHKRGGVWSSRLAIEQPPPADGGVAVVNRNRHN